MNDVEQTYDCPRCLGTGSLESSDSTDESWWDCSTCEGTGKLEDRRRLDPKLQRVGEERDRLLQNALRHLRSNVRDARELVAQDIERFLIRQHTGKQ